MTDASAAVSTAVGTLAFWAAWLAASVFELPLIWYLPLERQFLWSTQPPALGMSFFGQLLFAVAVGTAAGKGAWGLTRGRSLSGTHVRLATGGCALTLCLVGTYYALAMWGRVP